MDTALRLFWSSTPLNCLNCKNESLRIPLLYDCLLIEIWQKTKSRLLIGYNNNFGKNKDTCHAVYFWNSSIVSWFDILVQNWQKMNDGRPQFRLNRSVQVVSHGSTRFHKNPRANNLSASRIGRDGLGIPPRIKWHNGPQWTPHLQWTVSSFLKIYYGKDLKFLSNSEYCRLLYERSGIGLFVADDN